MGWGGFYPWGGDVGIPAAFQLGAASEIANLLADPYATFDFVMEALPYRQGEVDTGYPDAWGAFPWGFGGDANTERLYYGWRGMVTGPTDTPANTYMPPILSTPVNFELQVAPSGSGDIGSSGGFGTVEFATGVDADIEAYWAGRAIEMKIGGIYGVGASATTLPYADYGLLYRFRVQDIEYDEDVARLSVRDGMQALDKTLQSSTYSGVGTYEGDDQLKGQYKPLCYGQLFNVPAVLVNSTSFIYQFHDGPVSDITDVRVNGKSLTDAGNTTDLPGWTGGSATQYKTDKSRGLVRLWAQPDGQVTADVLKGVVKAGLVIRKVLQDGGIVELDEGTFFGFSDATVGYYVGTIAETIGTVAQNIAASLDSWVYTNRQGLFSLGEHGDPINDPPIYTIEGRRGADAPSTIVGIRRATTPPAPYRVKVAYKHNWTLQSTDSLDAALTELQKQSYSLPYASTEYASNARAGTVYRGSVYLHRGRCSGSP
jgi:hypothetical protein